MDKFIDPKTGKIVLEIKDDGSSEIDQKFFDKIKNQKVVIKMTALTNEQGITTENALVFGNIDKKAK